GRRRPDGERGSSSSGRPANLSVVCATVGTTGPFADRHRAREDPAMTPGLDETNRPRLSPTVRAHLADARECRAEAAAARTPAAGDVAPHRGALRAAGAVRDARPRPMDGRRRRLRSAWELLPEAEPRLAEWAAYFAISAHKRAAA